MKRNLFFWIKENPFTLTGAKYTLGLLIFGIFSMSIMSFTGLPGKDKKLIKPKPGPKGFVTLLPTSKPVNLDPATGRISDAPVSSTEDVKVALNPRVENFAEHYISRERTSLTRMKVWAAPMFQTIDKILTDYNLPTQLKYLAVIESSLRPTLRMKISGALGIWQLMPNEGRRYGLIADGHDYRTDVSKSTVAAAKLLTTLHNHYHDWLLTIAAYNAGMGRVNSAIKKAGSSDFWKVQAYLPQETRNHVKKFISTHYFFEGSGGLTTMGAKETQKYNDGLVDNSIEDADDDVVELMPSANAIRIRGMYSADAICKVLDIDRPTFDKLNPNFTKAISDGQFYDMHLPDGKSDSFVAKKSNILELSFNQLLSDSDNKTYLPKNRTIIDR